MPAYQFAEFNIARLSTPLDSKENTEFASLLEAVARIAEVSTGFVWRLTDDGGRNAAYVKAYDDPQLIINLTVWTDAESLRHYTYRSGHGAYFRRRKEWFDEDTSAMVCWWIPEGQRPTVDDGMRRLELLRSYGPSIEGFSFSDPFDPPTA